MAEVVNEAVIKVTADATGVHEGLAKVEQAAAKTGRTLDNLGGSPGLRPLGEGSGAAAGQIDKATKNMADAIQRATAAMSSGAKGTAEYYAALASSRGLKMDALKPFLAQLDDATTKAAAAAAAQKQLDDSMKFLADLKSRADGVGKTASELLELRAAELGVTDAAGPMIRRLREAEEAAENGSSKFGKYGDVIEKAKGILLALGAGAALGAFAAAVSASVDNLAELDDMAQKTGSSVESLSRLQKVASVFATDMGLIDGALTKLARGMTSVDDEGSKTERALKAIGLSAKDASGKLRDPSELMVDIAKKLQGYSDGASKAALVTDLFGKSGADLLPYLNDLSENYDRMAITSGVAASAAANLQDQVGFAKLRFQELATFTTTAVLPALSDLAGAFGDVLKEQNSLNGGQGAEWADDLAVGVARVVDVAILLPRLFSSIAGSFKTVAADAAVLLDFNPANMARKALQGRDPIKELKQTLADRNAALEEANRKYDELWNRPANEFEQAVLKRISDRKSPTASADQDNDDLDYSSSDKGAKDAEKAAEAYKSLIQAVQEKIRATAAEAAGLKPLTESQKLQADLDEMMLDAKRRLTPARKAEYEAAIQELGANEKLIAQRKELIEGIDQYTKAYEAASQGSANAAKNLQAQRDENEAIGLTARALADLNARRLDELAVRAEAKIWAAEGLDITGQMADEYRKEAAALRERAAAMREGAVKRETDDSGKKALEDLTKFLDPARAQTFGEALREAFGSGGDALSKLMANLDGLGKRQAEIIEQRKNADKARGRPDFDEAKYLKSIAELSEREVKNRVQGYGDMASAAKGFFSDGSKGYKLMEGAERAFRAMELASQMESLYTHLFVTGAKATGTAAGQAVETSAVVAGEAARNVAKVPGVFMSFLSALGPWGMAAAGVAIAAVLGGAFSGGGVSVSESRQKSQGTGTVLGSDAKSESIAKSLEMIENATFQGLSISTDMLSQLRSIDSNLTNFSTLVVQTTSIKGSLADGLESGSGGFWGKLGNSIFGGKTTVEDTGFSMNRIAFADVFRGMVNSYEYADTKKSGGWFSSDKYRTQIEGLGEEGNRQIALVLTSLYGAVESAGGMLGLAGKDFTDKLNSFVVDIGMVSLKGLSGEEIEKEIQAVFSKVGDQLALYSLDGLKDFQKSGEGYLETLTRIATGYQTVTVVAESLGMPFDAIGVGSIAARQRLIDLAGGLDEFKESADSFMSDFYTDKERADALRARIQPTLDKFGIQTGADDSMDQFRDVVKSLRLETAAGAQDFATLMQIMPAFKQIADIDKAKFEERLDLQDQLDELTLSSVDLLLKQRDALDASNRSLFDQVNAAEKAREVADERKSLQDQLDELTLTSAQLLNKQREALDGSNRSLFDQIEAIKQANKIATERKGLQDEYDQLTLSSEQLLRKQRDALDSSNRGLFDQVQAIKAATDAQEKATAAQEKATQAAKQRGADLLSGVDSQFSALQSVVNREKALLQDVADKHKALADALRGTLDSMSVSGQEREDRSAAQAQIAAALAIAKASGTLPDVDSLKGALSIVSKDSASLFSTQEEYLRDFYATQGDIADLAGLTDKTLSVEEQSIKRLDDILANAQQQVNALKGLDTTMLTLVDVMRDFDRSIGAAQADPVASAGGTLTKLYRELLGRAPDAGGIEFYKARMAEGVTLEQIRNDILQSLEYKQLKGIPGFAGGGFFGGGYRIVGENGPELEATGPSRIFNASQTNDMLARLSRPSEDYAALLAEVRVLRTAFSGLFPVLYQVAKNTGRGANSLEKMDRREEVSA